MLPGSLCSVGALLGLGQVDPADPAPRTSRPLGQGLPRAGVGGGRVPWGGALGWSPAPRPSFPWDVVCVASVRIKGAYQARAPSHGILPAHFPAVLALEVPLRPPPIWTFPPDPRLGHLLRPSQPCSVTPSCLAPVHGLQNGAIGSLPPGQWWRAARLGLWTVS